MYMRPLKAAMLLPSPMTTTRCCRHAASQTDLSDTPTHPNSTPLGLPRAATPAHSHRLYQRYCHRGSSTNFRRMSLPATRGTAGCKFESFSDGLSPSQHGRSDPGGEWRGRRQCSSARSNDGLTETADNENAFTAQCSCRIQS